MPKKCSFPDDSYIEWANKECVNYVEPNRKVQVWVDHEPGLFSRGRIIRLSSLNNWTEVFDGAVTEIDEQTRLTIIEKIKLYFGDTKISIED
jgi:hypothetical protein